MKNLIFSIALISLVLYAATPQKEYGSIYVDEILRVYDGDTFYCNINQWPKILGENIGIRINGIDTPEIRGSSPEIKKYAYQAKAIILNALTRADEIVLKNIKRGKYFRVVADVYADGNDVTELLFAEGLAKRYDGGTKDKWTIEDVNKIPEVN
jgi:endonuclease YncB( thermonuclease family)